MSTPEIVSFIVATTVLAFTPGPDNIFVVVTSLGQGFNTALKFIFGLATGIVLHTFLIVIGISTIISQSHYGLTILKVFAIGYLVYLAYKTFMHRKDLIHLNQQKKVDNYFVRGFIMNITNPKVLMFFLAFFPQFANLDQAGYQHRLVLLGGIFILVTLIVFSSIAWISAKGSQRVIENTKYSLFINWLAIVVFISVSILLLFT